MHFLLPAAAVAHKSMLTDSPMQLFIYSLHVREPTQALVPKFHTSNPAH